MIDTIEVKLLGPDGEKTLKLRPTTDTDWLAYYRAKKTILDRNGEVEPNSAADLELVNKLRLEDSPTCDDDEASLVVRRLSRVAIENVERVAGSFKVTAKLPEGPRIVTVAIPSAKQLNKFRALNRSQALQYGRQRIHIDFDGMQALYRDLSKEEAGVPFLLQIATLQAVMDSYERMTLGGGDEDEGF